MSCILLGFKKGGKKGLEKGPFKRRGKFCLTKRVEGGGGFRHNQITQQKTIEILLLHVETRAVAIVMQAYLHAKALDTKKSQNIFINSGKGF